MADLGRALLTLYQKFYKIPFRVSPSIRAVCELHYSMHNTAKLQNVPLKNHKSNQIAQVAL